MTTYPHPQVTYESGQWRLTESVEIAGILIPAGFRFDIASIPRLLWPLISSFELSLAAPLVHDYLYKYTGLGQFSRKGADRLFLRIMKEQGVAAWRRWPAYLAVRLFGWTGWEVSDG